ncbi:hypothetical protein AVEN_126427-1 [Araneus ventricosus]|uniref:Transposable element Tc1 transposase n=1 Tax=Araneus ventricosus TaxID=182803 RepID=A0A4Y2VS91_ARAVE|nr:hypothetical protein AVEN_126427-1 [Araneus ventricosus]
MIDQSRFNVQPDNRRIIIWRERGTRNYPAFVHESVLFDGGGVMVWSSVSINGHTDLYIIRNGALTLQLVNTITRKRYDLDKLKLV